MVQRLVLSFFLTGGYGYPQLGLNSRYFGYTTVEYVTHLNWGEKVTHKKRVPVQDSIFVLIAQPLASLDSTNRWVSHT